jgi:ABC-2 type transport system permease protein
MMLIIIATLPIYSIVFLYGGISPTQLISVFLFYIFIMIVLGSFGILFSTLFKKTVISIITAYGVTLFFYGFTGILAIFLGEVMRSSSGTSNILPGIILSTNPMAALISIFEPGFSQDVFQNQSTSLQLWHIFVPVFAVLSLISILLSIRFLRPVLKKRKS